MHPPETILEKGSKTSSMICQAIRHCHMLVIMSALDILPDSRAKVARGSVRRVQTFGDETYVTNWIPVYCHNCGKDNGYVPEENCNFTFWLCDPCAEKWGDKLFDHYVEPDVVFWQRVKEEQLDKHQREMTQTELLAELENPNTPLAKMFRERLAKGPL